MKTTTRKGFGALETPPHRAADIPDLEQVGIAWRDNAFFGWWDPEQEIYGQVHVSTTPNGEGSRALCAMFADGRAWEVCEPLGEATFSSESITVDLAGHLTVRHDRLELDLELDPLFHPVDWVSAGVLPETRPGRTLNHYQHGFAARGSATLDGRTVTVDCSGWRDRTWGYREESQAWREYFYLCSVFEHDYAVVLWKVLGADGRRRCYGSRISAEEQTPIESFSITRDAAANLASATLELPSGTLQLTTLPKPSGFQGWWLPMGRSEQEGPTFCEYDDYCLLQANDGRRGGGIAAHGVLREIG